MILETMKYSIPKDFSGRLAVGLVAFNLAGAVLTPALLAGAGYVVGWVIGGVAACLLILCPFVTIGIICHAEDYLCRWCYSPEWCGDGMQDEPTPQSGPDTRNLEIPMGSTANLDIQDLQDLDLYGEDLISRKIRKTEEPEGEEDYAVPYLVTLFDSLPGVEDTDDERVNTATDNKERENTLTEHKMKANNVTEREIVVEEKESIQYLPDNDKENVIQKWNAMKDHLSSADFPDTSYTC